MTPFKLAISNIRKSIKDFAIYFVTLLLGICLFYVFNAIESQGAMLRISEDTREIFSLLTQVISYISIFIAAVLGFLVIYSSRFMMKRRNKEFALYMLLGMGKRKVSLVLFFENFIIGTLSLVLGLALGVGISQITSVFVAYLFQADMSGFQFVFSMNAFTKTIIYFAIIYLIVILFNTFAIGKCKLITLLQSGRKSEKEHKKLRVFQIPVCILSMVGLGYAYWLVDAERDFRGKNDLGIAILLGVVCTFLFFWSFSGLILRLVTMRKKHYYKGLNSFVTRQFSSQASANVASISIICLLFFITICTLASAINIRNAMNANLKKYCPADMQFVTFATSIEQQEKDIAYLSTLDVDMKKSILVKVISPKYQDDDMQYFCHEVKSLVESQDPDMQYLLDEISNLSFTESEYNKIADWFGTEKVHLQDDEYIVVANQQYYGEIIDYLLKNGAEVEMKGKTLHPWKACHIKGSWELNSAANNTGFVVLPDSVVETSDMTTTLYYGDYKATDREEARALDDKIEKMTNDMTFENQVFERGYEMDFRNSVQDESIGVGATATFVALYIGFIFLLSGAAILAIKQMSEASDNVSRYKMLRKLGADEKMIRRALLRQIALFFLLPLALAIVHSVAGMIFSKKILELMGTEYLAFSICLTAVIFLAIYGAYFLITYFNSRRMIRER